MTICIITSYHDPKDIRLYWKQALSLEKEGHKIVFALMHIMKIKQSEGNISWISIKKPKNRYLRFINTVRLLFLSLFLKVGAYQLSVSEVLWFSLFIRIFKPRVKIIYDCHEPLELFIPNKPWVPRFFKPVVYRLVIIYEWFYTLFCNAVIVCAESRIKHFKRWHRKAVLVRNFPYQRTSPIKSWLERNKIILNLSGLSVERGLPELAAISRKIAESETGYHLHLHGIIVEDIPTIVRDCLKALKLYKALITNDWRTLEQLALLLEDSRFGIFFRRTLDYAEFTTHNKLFEYAIYGTIPIVHNCKGMSMFIENGKTGFLVDYGSEADQIQKILEISPEELAEISATTAELFNNKYIWEKELPKYLSVYNK